jgi:hypothetical protein
LAAVGEGAGHTYDVVGSTYVVFLHPAGLAVRDPGNADALT